MLIKTLSKSIRQYKKDTLLSSGFVFLEVIVEVLIPFHTASLIDLGINVGDMDYIIRMGIMLVVFALLSLLFGSLSGVYASGAASGYGANLRHDIFAAVQRFSFSNINRFSSASLVTRLTTDCTNVLLAYQAIIRQGVRAISMVLFSLAMAFRTNTQVTRIFLVIAPLLAIGLLFIAIKAHPFFANALKTYDRLNNIVQENLQGIRVVKSFVREAEETNKFNNVSGDIYTYFTKGQRRVSFNMPLIQLSCYTGILLVSWLSAQQIVSDNMTTGDLMSMFAYVMQILMNLMLLSAVFVQIIIAGSSATRIVEVLNETPEIQNPKNPLTKVEDGSIVFKNVNFSYIGDKNKLCLMGANFRIASGETIGIIGGTGSSKTSLVQLIPRLYDTTEGCVLLGGEDVRAYDTETLRNEVAVVLQTNVLFTGTIRENILWGNPVATDEEIHHAASLACAHEFIESFPDGYDTMIEEGGTNVSGGQRQRICIARTLLKKPKVLILDDSTSAVDTKTDAMIRKAFREEIPGTTKLIIAQRISSVLDADRIIVMDGGKINAIGTHDKLLATNIIYREVYNTQMLGGGDFDE